MDILILSSHTYCMPYCVMLTSLIHNNPATIINLHVMVGPGLTPDDRKDLTDTIESGENNTISFYEIGSVLNDLFSSLPKDRKDRITSVYSKLFVDKILPESLDKVLWLDGDLVVRHSLNELWNINITNYPVAYVRDVGNNNIGFFNRMKYPYEDGYFNTGVILINLKYWRRNDIHSKIMDILDNYSDRIRILDQDVYSMVFHDNKLVLPFKYNFQTWLLMKPEYQKLYYEVYGKEIEKDSMDPIIYHYIGSDKPWMRFCYQPGVQEWEKYQNMTKWKGEKRMNPRSYRITLLKRFVKFILNKKEPNIFNIENALFLRNNNFEKSNNISSVKLFDTRGGKI